MVSRSPSLAERLREAVHDDERIQSALAMMKVGIEGGDPPMRMMQVVLADFVKGILEPEDRLRVQPGEEMRFRTPEVGKIAVDTSEATLIVRNGPWCIKYLRPAESFTELKNPKLRMSARETLWRWRKMAALSVHPPFNLLTFTILPAPSPQPPVPVFLSRYIEGRPPTPDELQAVNDDLRRQGLRVLDVTRENVIVGEQGPVVVDWFVEP